ncbi:MAG: two-component system sensor histidine kinase [Paenibacillus sp.]|jgi:signal transduction histidine kinase|nr:two-component system sensor histidine kinase [Paenibacillus sp.]
MQLTKRFFTMNALVVLISIAVTALAAAVVVAVYMTVFDREANLQHLQTVFETRSGMAELQKEAGALEFEQLLSADKQRWLADRVRALGADAIVLRNRDAMFSTAAFHPIAIEKTLLLSGDAAEPSSDTIELDGKLYMVARADYTLRSGGTGVLLLLAPIRLKTDFYLFVGLFTIVFFVTAFLTMNLFVSRRFSRGIIRPVTRLNDAARKISDGDLNGGIAEEGWGEVKELGRTLELMRIKLKESRYMQNKYEENRKFLVSSISHDLKTPVASIIGYIEGIIDGVAKTEEKRAEYLETARSKAILVNVMIDDLLLYSRLDLNLLPYHFERTELGPYFEDCVADYRVEFERARIGLSLVHEWKEPPTVRMDRERLKRVVQNILDNAMKYVNQADGQVTILLRDTQTSAIIEIRDNGAGIPEEHLPHIFDRFYRSDHSRKSAEGSGLGLAIAKQIVEDHDGKIWARSKAGEGTRMMISLPKL